MNYNELKKRLYSIKPDASSAEQYSNLCMELLQRYKPETDRLVSLASVAAYCKRNITQSEVEEFHIITVNTKMEPIEDHLVSKGDLNATPVFTREIFRLALKDNAYGIFVWHTHPSGCTTLSDNDKRVTRNLRDAGKILEIKVVDHVVVSPITDDYDSYEN